MNDSEDQETGHADVHPDERFYEIFRQNYRRVYVFFVRKGFSDEESDELVQETFLRVHRNLQSFRGESSFDTWLFEVAAGVYRNELRGRSVQKRGVAKVSLEEDSPDEQSGPLDDLLSGERRRVLLEALADLPPQMRRCVELRVHQDLKYREIAEVMMVSIDTVKRVFLLGPMDLDEVEARLPQMAADLFPGTVWRHGAGTAAAPGGGSCAGWGSPGCSRPSRDRYPALPCAVG